ncbi:CWC16 protein [Irpex rosettiformis]|uniref:CWC16 protein n=1 Tax=Irpex rosettiformis TaxID=378272 RepID=A0ACB8U723_9APHY|nr:CWC16 protein [Irpex rosettiformis]
MQGFNKYYPPDYDGEKHKSLNSYRGKHALGDRARKIDQGILITRFELPFNIWCGTCNNHIGMGVRYNAEKKKIGNYYSTPIYSFRCKCHLCDGWFEIQTDPKNTRYVVTSGARQKQEDWDPEENGGFAVHNTDPNEAPIDPLAALEKSTEAQNHMNKVQIPRLEALQSLADHYGDDPYTLSKLARKRFREEKKVEKEKQAADDALKGRYGLPETLKLTRDDEATQAKDKEEWERGKREFASRDRNKRRKLELVGIVPRNQLGSSSSSGSGRSSNAAELLRARILTNTARQKPGASTPRK